MGRGCASRLRELEFSELLGVRGVEGLGDDGLVRLLEPAAHRGGEDAPELGERHAAALVGVELLEEPRGRKAKKSHLERL